MVQGDIYACLTENDTGKVTISGQKDRDNLHYRFLCTDHKTEYPSVMHIIICGGGGVGSSIAHQLTMENNDVTVIDFNPDVITEITEHLDVRGVIGFPSYPSILEEAGIREADALIAVTRSDEINMVICQVAYSLFKVPLRIARIRSTDYLQPEWQMLYRHDHIPIDHIISPEQEVARTIYDRLRVPGAVDTISLAGDDLLAIGLRCAEGSDISGQRLSYIREVCGEHNSALLGAVRHGTFILPQRHEFVEQGDILYIVCRRQNISEVMPLFGHENRRARDVVIVGAGNIGMFLVKYLESDAQKTRIRIIEKNRKRADFAASQLSSSHTTVLHGDAMSEAIIRDAGIAVAGHVVCVTEDDKVNIMVSFLAKKLGCRRTASIINHPRSVAPVLEDTGIDIIVNPREITVSSILRYIRTGKVLSIRSMCFGKVELLEIVADERSPVTGKGIKNLALPHGTVIAALSRNGTLIQPEDDTVIHAGDLLTVLCEADSVHKTESIFSRRKELY